MRAQKRSKKFFKGTRALVMGIGLHGGGVATAQWLVRHGAQVTATDMRSRDVLAPSLHALRGVPVQYVLGKHLKRDFRTNELIVVNPGVPRESEFIYVARSAGKQIENDASLFFRHATNPVIGVTGTRGKTTTTLWIAELLKKKYKSVRPSGNTPDNALLKEFERVNGKNIPVVAELSSWQLEYLPQTLLAPHIAVITNIYPDHLNRYRDIEDYADAKAGIFANQSTNDFLILNHDNKWHTYFARKKPKGKLYYISTRALPRGVNGLFLKGGIIVFRSHNKERRLFSAVRFIKERGMHNLENLLHAVLAVTLFAPDISVSQSDARKLPAPPMRQEVIYREKSLAVVNDSCATSPDGTIAALRRFTNAGGVVLIVGGTDKMLTFAELAREIKKTIPVEQLILLEGTATTKLLSALCDQGLAQSILRGRVFSTLSECVRESFQVAQSLRGNTTILFSPGAASFEKFLHEFDRGRQFNLLAQKNIVKK